MKSYPTDRVRNILIVGHGGAGKTSLVEAVCHATGATNRLGRVEDGTTVTDFEPEETRKHISVSLAVAPVEHDGFKINLLDAPGYPGSAAVYKQQLANSVRMFALLHEQDIKDKGLVYGTGGKSPILANVDLMRQALDWADLANKTQNDAILDSLVATINAYPTP